MEIESTHEIEITPDELREIAVEMDRKAKHESFQPGQVIRFKVNERFAFVYRPAKTLRVLEDEGKNDRSDS